MVQVPPRGRNPVKSQTSDQKQGVLVEAGTQNGETGRETDPGSLNHHQGDRMHTHARAHKFRKHHTRA